MDAPAGLTTKAQDARAVEEIPEFLKSQLQQAIETYRVQLTLLVQILIALTLANATVVGYALSTRLAGVLFVGSLFPALILVISRTVAHLSVPIVSAAIAIEQRYSPSWYRGLMTTFLSYSMSPSVALAISTRAATESGNCGSDQLKTVPALTVGTDRGILRLVLIGGCLGQIIAPFVLARLPGWRLL